MTDLTPVAGFDAVPQLERDTLALAGAGGPMNSQAQALLNRTEALKGFQDRLVEPTDPANGAGMIPVIPGGSYPPGTVGALLANPTAAGSAYPTRSAVEASNIAPEVDGIYVESYRAFGGGGAVYDRLIILGEAQAVIDRINAASIIPLTKKKEWAINNAIRKLKIAGLLSSGKIGALLEFGGAGQGEQGAALVDWIRPTVLAPSITGSGTIYVPGKGLQFSGSSYVSLGATFDTIPGVTLNQAHAGVFIDGTGPQDYTEFNSNPMIGAGSRLGLRPSNSLGAVSALINTNTAALIGTEVAGRAGHTIASRISASLVEAYRDGDLMGQAASATQSISPSNVTIGWWSTPNQFATDTVGFAHFGGALNASDASILYDIMTEYRYIIQSGANPGSLLQSADGAWWELGQGFARTPYHYGADEIDDTIAFRDMCAAKQDAYIPTPRSLFRVVDGFKVFARIESDGARVRMDINTHGSRSWDMQDKSKFIGASLQHSVNASLPPISEGGQHCAILMGRFHGTQTPVRDVEIDLNIEMLTPAPAAVYVIGNVKRPKISYYVSGRQVNGAAFLAHWGTQQSDSSNEHVICRPRDGYIKKGIAHSKSIAGHRGFYYSGVCNWRADYIEARNFTACMGVAPGDKPNDMDAACFNETVGQLMANITFGRVDLLDPAGTACRMWGRTAFIGGKRWYSTDLDTNASIEIGELNILRSAATSQAGNEAIMLDLDIANSISIKKLSINHRPGTPQSVIDVLEPLVRINGGRNVDIKGTVIGRIGTHVYSGNGISLKINSVNPNIAESSSASAGVWLTGETVTGTLTAPVNIGDTSISLLRSPATHIVPGMQFEYGGVRYTFTSSQAGDNLLDDNVTMQIAPATAAIPNAALIVVLGGASNVKLRGSEFRHYRGIVSAGSDPRIPNNIHITPNVTYSRDDGMELDCGSGYFITGGVFDFNNRRNDAAARDIRINANVNGVHVTGVRFSPSPGSRLTVNHILANAACSGIIARDNYGYGSVAAKFSIPAAGADGVPNVNSNYEAP